MLRRPARRHRLLPRHPAPHWALAAGLAVACALVVGRAVLTAQEARARYGETEAVAVAARDLPAGHRLTAGDLRRAELPAWAVPPERADAATAPGAVLSAPVYAGEVLLAPRLAPAPLGAVAALLPPGTRGVAVPAGPAELRLRRGDVVDVLATVDPELSGAEPTFAVATHALVVDVAEDAVTVAVDEDAAPRVAFAVVHGIVTLVLRGAE